jgi:hypothetical protein
MKRLISIGIVFVLALSVASLMLAQSDPFVGTWKLNVRKSKFGSDQSIKSETRMVVTGPTGMNVSVERVNADGSIQEFEYTTNLDGKGYPMMGQGPYGADTISANLTAPGTIQSILTKDGKVVANATSVVSKNGKILTITTKGKDANGSPFSSVGVYDKR